MAVSAEEIEYLSDHFADLGRITTRKMMGGLCLYADGQIFALRHSGGLLFLKAKGALADELAGLGQKQFSMERDGAMRSMGYWTLPADALDDPDLGVEWGRKALAALR